MDIFGPTKPTIDGHRYGLVLRDTYHGQTVIVPLKDITAPTIAKAVMEKWISVYGHFRILFSDNGSDLASNVITHLCNTYGIQKRYNSYYNPRCDGSVERTIQDIKKMIRIITTSKNINHSRWNEYSNSMSLTINNRKTQKTGVCPNRITFGRRFQLPVDINLEIRDDLKNNNQYKYYMAYMDILRKLYLFTILLLSIVCICSI